MAKLQNSDHQSSKMADAKASISSFSKTKTNAKPHKKKQMELTLKTEEWVLTSRKKWKTDSKIEMEHEVWDKCQIIL
jgi:hypothetical protein